MIVAGVMSGTSADGINVAVVELRARGRGGLRYTLLGHSEYNFPPAVRRTILSMMNAESARVADLARLNFLLGELYAEAVLKAARKLRVKVELIGCHGQTLYHQGIAQRFLGKKLAVTWQTGEGAVLAARAKAPVVSDFRPADMAAGGRGAPLVPFLDYFLFRDHRIAPRARNRIAQNVGGIANLTAIPAGAASGDVLAFDTGPGNMVIDALMEKMFGKRFDLDGKVAASGLILEKVVAKVLESSFFDQRPPRTAGREEFGRQFADRFLRQCRGARKVDIVATATAVTARSITRAVQRFVIPKFVSNNQSRPEMIVSGGGAKNSTLMAMLRRDAEPLKLSVRLSDEFGLPSEAKEAVAFALLAYETWNRRPSNLPSATGALRPAILGKVSYV